MGKYQDVNCPICGESLENGKIVVICPECGAPYHKECVDKEGKCIYDDLHAQGKSWELPKKEQKFAGDEPKRCSRCGTINPMDGLFCEVCGNPLNRPEHDNQGTPQAQQRPNMGQQFYGPGGPQGFQRPPQQMAYDPYTTPFGGVNPDEVIDSIPVKDWAIYIGQNTQYFIPKFKDMSESKRSASFNFAAMFFNGFYFLYRKMFLWGAMLIVVLFALEIPGTLVTIKQMWPGIVDISIPLETLVYAANICSVVRFGMMALCGVFANKLYKIHCNNKISKLRETVTEHHDYVNQLTRSGGASAKVIMILLAAYFAICFLSAMMFLVV